MAPAAGIFVSGMLVAGAVAVAIEVSEPLENYEVDLKWWQGSYAINLDYGDRQTRTQYSYNYTYDPATGVAFYQDIQRIWVADETGYYSDQSVYYDPFPFSADSCDVNHTYFQVSPNPNVFHSYWGSVNEYYVKRNGNAWFGRPVRAHVTGSTWTPTWPGADIRVGRLPTGGWGHDQWVFVPRNSWAAFSIPWSNAFQALYGYATTAYELF